MNPLFKIVGGLITSSLLSNLVTTQQHTRYRVQKMIVGTSLIFASVVIAAIGIVFAVAGFFFALTDLSEWLIPALLTAGITLLISLLAFTEGWRHLKLL